MIVPDSRHAVNRFVKTIPEQQIVYGQYGRRVWEADFMHKTRREKPTRVNECWFGDHHVFDLFVLDERGKPVRPWITAWMDALSGAFVGWVLTLNPNSDTITDSFCRGGVYTVGSSFVGLPALVYMDNGKDYRSSRFEGDALVEYDIGKLNAELWERSLLQKLGVEVKRAIPYRAWSKTIERAFGTLENRWIREFPGWCGNSPDQRPEDNGRIIKRLMERGELMTFETFAQCFAERVLPEYHAFKGEDGMSPMELYQSAEKARADIPNWETMALFKSMSAKRVVGTQGVRFDSMIYWHPALSDYVRKEITVLHNRGANASVTIMRGEHYVCEAEPIETMALIERDETKIARHMAEQGGQRRKVTDRLARLHQSVRHATREMYAEAIDEQRNRSGATMVSMEAEKARAGKQKVEAKARARRGQEAEGANKAREMMMALGREVAGG